MNTFYRRYRNVYVCERPELSKICKQHFIEEFKFCKFGHIRNYIMTTHIKRLNVCIINDLLKCFFLFDTVTDAFSNYSFYTQKKLTKATEQHEVKLTYHLDHSLGILWRKDY